MPNEHCRYFVFINSKLLANVLLVKEDVTNKTSDDKNESTKSVSVDITEVREGTYTKWITKHTNNHQDCAQHNCDKS